MGLFCCLLGDRSGGICWDAEEGAEGGAGLTGLVCCQGFGIGEVSWALQALAFELLDTVLDLTGSVDGE